MSIFRDRISSRIDSADEVLLISLENRTIQKRETIRIIPSSPLDKIRQIIQLNPDVLICGGLTQSCDNMLKNSEVSVVPWIKGNTEEVLNQFLDGTLSDSVAIIE
jgi:predicted Fe-Mo cluster-binding NifX family protein